MGLYFQGHTITKNRTELEISVLFNDRWNRWHRIVVSFVLGYKDNPVKFLESDENDCESVAGL